MLLHTKCLQIGLEFLTAASLASIRKASAYELLKKLSPAVPPEIIISSQSTKAKQKPTFSAVATKSHA